MTLCRALAKKSMKNRTKILLLVLLIAAICLSHRLWEAQTKNLVFYITSPIQKLLWATGNKTADFLETPFLLSSIKKENQALKEQNLALIKSMAELKKLREENAILKDILKISTEKKMEIEAAEILQKEESRDVLVISKGTDKGILKGMAVITKDEVLVGKIMEAQPNFSRVLLISDIKSSFNIEIPREDKKITGILKGDGNFKLGLDYIPKEEQINEKDLVITASFGGEFPTGILIGEIVSVAKNDAEPYQQAVVKPFFEPLDLTTVLVIKNIKSNSF